jgi:predicted  nucleic acid-binding Zn-ribbon protein
VAYDRADYQTALRVWLPAAEAGDAKAQNYVGEIYEKGLGVPPDFERAAEWYRRAAERGDPQAQVNLGQLHERGLGVPQDSAAAVSWYRRASGLQGTPLDFLPSVAPGVDSLQQELAQRARESDALRAELRRVQDDLAAARAERSRGETEVSGERQALERSRAELEAARAELDAERRRLAIEQERLDRDHSTSESERAQLARQAVALEKRESDLVRRMADLERRSADLRDRESALEDRERSIAGREQELRRLEAELSRRENEAAKASQAESRPEPSTGIPLPGPTIELIEPSIPATRGVQVVAAGGATGARLIVGRVEAPAGLLALTVNDLELQADGRGIFQTRVPLAAGSTPVTVVAVDRQGKRAEREFLLEPKTEASLPSPPLPQPPRIEFGNYVALVIGNDDYAYLPDLATATSDARSITRVLEERYGFSVRLLLDADRYQTLSALNELRTTLTERDNFLLYYAGHGELDEANMRGHWLPVDAEAASTANWISNVAVTDILNAMAARHVLVVADSCYSGSLTRASLARLDAGMTDEAREAWIRAMVTKRSRTALTSGGLKPVLDSGGGGRHSLFARIFLEVLEANEDVLEGHRLFREVSARVTWVAEGAEFEQVPQYAPIRFAGHEAGEFFLVPSGEPERGGARAATGS